MRQLFCNEHGSLEETRAYSICLIPRDKYLVIYTPPGAALADDLAEFIMNAFVNGTYGHDLKSTIDVIQQKLLVKGREAKGFVARCNKERSENMTCRLIDYSSKIN